MGSDFQPKAKKLYEKLFVDKSRYSRYAADDRKREVTHSLIFMHSSVKTGREAPVELDKKIGAGERPKSSGTNVLVDRDGRVFQYRNYDAILKVNGGPIDNVAGTVAICNTGFPDTQPSDQVGTAAGKFMRGKVTVKDAEGKVGEPQDAGDARYYLDEGAGLLVRTFFDPVKKEGAHKPVLWQERVDDEVYEGVVPFAKWYLEEWKIPHYFLKFPWLAEDDIDEVSEIEAQGGRAGKWFVQRFGKEKLEELSKKPEVDFFGKKVPGKKAVQLFFCQFVEGVLAHKSYNASRASPGRGFDFYRLKRGVTDQWWFPVDLGPKIRDVRVRPLEPKSGGRDPKSWAGWQVPPKNDADQMKEFYTAAAIPEFFKLIEEKAGGGQYPIGTNGMLHGGVHLYFKDKDDFHRPIFAAASGQIVAARLPKQADLKDKKKKSSNGFVLIKHDLYWKNAGSGPEPPSAAAEEAIKSIKLTPSENLGPGDPVEIEVELGPAVKDGDEVTIDLYQKQPPQPDAGAAPEGSPDAEGGEGWLDKLYNEPAKPEDKIDFTKEPASFYSLYMHIGHPDPYKIKETLDKFDAIHKPDKDIPDWILRLQYRQQIALMEKEALSKLGGEGGEAAKKAVKLGLLKKESELQKIHDDTKKMLEELSEGKIVFPFLPVCVGDKIAHMGKEGGMRGFHFEVFSGDEIDEQPFTQKIESATQFYDAKKVSEVVGRNVDLTKDGIKAEDAKKLAPTLRAIRAKFKSEWAGTYPDYKAVISQETYDEKVKDQMWWEEVAKGKAKSDDPKEAAKEEAEAAAPKMVGNKWAKDEAMSGEEIEIEVTCENVPDGAQVELDILTTEPKDAPKTNAAGGPGGGPGAKSPSGILPGDKAVWHYHPFLFMRWYNTRYARSERAKWKDLFNKESALCKKWEEYLKKWLAGQSPEAGEGPEGTGGEEGASAPATAQAEGAADESGGGPAVNLGADQAPQEAEEAPMGTEGEMPMEGEEGDTAAGGDTATATAEPPAPVSADSAVVAPATETPATTAQPQPSDKPKTIKGRFKTATAYCGDEVEIEAEAENIDDGKNVAFNIRKAADKTTIRAEGGPLASKQVRGLKWICKCPDATVGQDGIDFEVSCEGAKADSENKFTFKRFADSGSMLRSIHCTSGRFGWTGKFDTKFASGEMTITFKVKLQNRQGAKPANATDPEPAIGAAVSDEDKATMKADIEGKLSGKAVLHRKSCKRGDTCNCPADRKCCKIPVKVVVEFVESGEHHLVNLWQGNCRANATNWSRVKTRDNSLAHESGHLLAWYDEYVGGAVNSPPRWTTPNPSAVMGSGLTVPKEYFWDFRDFLKDMTSEEWVAVAP